MLSRIRDLRGLGIKSEAQLAQLGIDTVDELREIGAVPAFLALRKLTGKPPSMNLLYALVGALENKDWRDVAKHERDRLLFDLDGHAELAKVFTKDAGD
ncbi:MAG: TfoX/Sxy family protein [Woeseiaceae bacterium]